MNQPSILKSPAYRFQLTYPRYISATWFSASQLANLSPVPLGAVELRDTENTLSDIAPPMLTVQIYSNTGHLALAQWLDTSPRLQPASNWTIKQIRVSTYDGLLAESHQYLSPGQYIFVAKYDLIYQFVVAGDIAQSILDSLQLN